MTFLRILMFLLALCGGFTMQSPNAAAQAAHDTSLLTQAERTHYAARLSQSNDSAQRAKVKAEMNRLIQTRRLELRKQHKKP